MNEGSGELKRAFVVWDSTARAVRTNLELLKRSPPPGWQVEALSLDRKGTGAIWRSNVEPNLKAAELALALIDLPNANVGLEIGFALGLAGSGREDVKTRRVRLASASGTVPKWLDRPPFRGQLVATASEEDELVELITDGKSMEIPSKPRSGQGVLLLCPANGPGQGIGRLLTSLRPGWKRPATEGWEIRELPKVLDGIGRVVWVILSYPGEEQRDGAENAAAAAIAGYAMAHGVEVLGWQHEEARDVLDLGTQRREWQTIEDLERLVRDLDGGAPVVTGDVVEVHLRTLLIIHRDLVPFFAHVEKPLGDVFVELMLDLQPGRRGDEECGVPEKLALREMPTSLASKTPTLQQLLEVEEGLSGRYVILGEPGAGKSTLLRHLCFVMAQQPGDAIPVFVSLARLARDGQHSVFDLAQQDAAFHFDEATARGLADCLRNLTDQGRVWLFLDGLDEVAGDSDRARIRAMIEALATDKRIARVVVTSREVGYERLQNGFVHARVRPLSDDGSQQLGLLRCWLNDRADEVWQRIQQSPRVTDLARNPLLLTLLAVIALEDKTLPPTRVKLYGRAVQLLLKRGHGRDARGVSDAFAAEAILAPLSLKLHETGEDAWSEAEVNRLLRELRAANAKVASDLDACRQTPQQFLTEVATQSGLIGGYQGPEEPWRYMHRSLREYLAARALLTEQPGQRLRFLPDISQLQGFARAASLEVAVNRWGETYALLVGLLKNDDQRRDMLERLRLNGPDLVLRILPQTEDMDSSLAWALLSVTEGWNGDHLLRMAHSWRFDGHDTEEIRRLLWPVPKQEPDVHRLACIHYALTYALIPFDETAFFAASGLAARPQRDWIRTVHLPPDGQDHARFWMGSPDGVGTYAEWPRHQVILSSFALGMTTVTEAQYTRFNPLHTESPRRHSYPAVNVNWFAARLFCRWVGGDLPTEAQWEYACRAGSDANWCYGDNKTHLGTYAWYDRRSHTTHRASREALVHPVGKKKPNDFGLYDMHGNVLEWCADWYGKYTDNSARSPAIIALDPTGPSTGAERVQRGGSAQLGAEAARSASREFRTPDACMGTFGFRVAFPGRSVGPLGAEKPSNTTDKRRL